jgi:hypothetical protein
VFVERTDFTGEERELADEADAVRRARIADVHALSPAERVERLHALCRQIVAFVTRSSGGAS